MDDKHKDATSAETPADAAVPRAKKGVQDAGQVVSGAAGEMFSGTVADITDGDRRKIGKKKS